MLDARRDVAGQCVCVGGREVHVHCAGGAVVCVEWMHGLDFAGVGVHAARGFAGFDVAPDHGCHVAFVVHEAGVEVWGFVGVGGHDVRGATGEWIL